MEKYKKNLRIEHNLVFSYNTVVAQITNKHLVQLGYWSKNTQKHINYIALLYDLEVINVWDIQNNFRSY